MSTHTPSSRSPARSRLLVIGPTPPPHYGVAVATESILRSHLMEKYELIHVDTSDRRQGLNFGRFDFRNILLGIKHTIEVALQVVLKRPRVTYIPISQGAAGYFRDALFIFIAAVAGSKIVLHLRGAFFRTFYETTNGAMKFLIRKSLARADRMIVLGECLRSLFHGLIPDDRIRVVPNGVDPTEFTLASPADTTRPKMRVGFLGNLYRSKGYFDLLSAMEQLNGDYPVECVLAGEWQSPSEKEHAMEYLHQNGMSDAVRFLGVVRGQEKKTFLSSCDVFVFPTYFEYEGHPWVILEAMAAGLPVVSTRHACVPEMVIHGETGLLVEKNQISDLSQAIKRLLSDPDLRTKMGKNGRMRVTEVLSKENFIKKLGAVFAEVIG